MTERVMKIVLVSSSFLPELGGREIYTYHLARELERRGHDVTLVTNTSDQKPDLGGVELVRLRGFSLFLDRNRQVRQRIVFPLLRALKDKCKDADIVHAQEYGSYSTDVSALFCKILNIPFVVTVHNPFLSNSSLFRALLLSHTKTVGHLALRIAKKVIFVSRSIQSAFERIFGAQEKFAFVPNAVDWELFQSRCSSSRSMKENIVVSLGRSSRMKNYELLVSAMPSVIEDVPDCRCLIAGPQGDYAHQLRNLAHGLGLSPSVKIIGPQVGMEKFNILSRASVFALCSKAEAFPTTLLEAMAAGIPPVATNVGDIPQIIKDEINGFICQMNAASLARRIVDLLKDRALWNRASDSAVRTSQLFSWHHVADSLVRHYHHSLAV